MTYNAFIVGPERAKRSTISLRLVVYCSSCGNISLKIVKEKGGERKGREREREVGEGEKREEEREGGRKNRERKGKRGRGKQITIR